MKNKDRVYVDYVKLYNALFGPGKLVTVQELKAELYVETGVHFNSVAQVITTLSIHYAIWSPYQGVYKIMEIDDEKYLSKGKR